MAAHNYGTAFAIVLPEPSSLALLGLGAIGLGAMQFVAGAPVGNVDTQRHPREFVNHDVQQQETAHESLEIRRGARGNRFVGIRRRPIRSANADHVVIVQRHRRRQSSGQSGASAGPPSLE